MKQVVVLAGGKGARLAERLGPLPKPMLDVAGKPLLQRQLELAREQGFTDVVLCTGYRADLIRAHFGDGGGFGLRIQYHEETQPLGTAGAVLAATPLLAERFVVLYGDTMLDVDLDRMWRTHADTGADATLLLHPNDHPHDSDLVELRGNGLVRAFHGYPHPPDRFLPNLVNAALYVIERRILARLDLTPPFDFAKDAFPRLLQQGAKLYGYRSPEYIKDMGTPERHDRVTADVLAGRPAALSLRQPQPAVFLDRDGVLNPCTGYVRSAEELSLYPGVAAAVHRLNQFTSRTVLVTNQPVIARGESSFDELERIHHKLETLLGREHAYLDRIYFCPHHPDAGFAGERRELKMRCECRKPATGMITDAVRDLGIDLSRSWLIGDTTVDVRTALNAGLRSVLLRTGEAGRDRKYPDRPDYTFFSLDEAVTFIAEEHARLRERLRATAERAAPGSLVAVGGLAHAGKSTTASVLRELVAERGGRAVVVALDNWIRAAAQRAGSTLGDQHDYPAMTRVVAELTARPAPLTLAMPSYDRATRSSSPNGATLEIAPDDVVILEGVVALELMRATPALKLYVECDEPLRRERFLRDYAWRGLDERAAAQLYDEREQHENGVIRQSRSEADQVVEAHT